MDKAAPEMSGYQARSFWLMLFATAIPIAKALGFDAEYFGLTQDSLTDLAMIIVPAVLAVWAYVERLYGTHKLRFVGAPKK